jgi:hypothetical protein
MSGAPLVPAAPLLPPKFDRGARAVADVLGIAAGLVVLISGFAMAVLGDGSFTAEAAFIGLVLGLAAGLVYRLSIGATLSQLEEFLQGIGGRPP